MHKSGVIFWTVFASVPTALLIPVWIRHRRGPALLRGLAVVTLGCYLPLLTFAFSAALLPDWKGGCRYGWVDGFLQGKLVLAPLVLWAIASLYALDALRLPVRRWMQWGLINGAVVAIMCLLHGLFVIDLRHAERIFWLVMLVPVYTAVGFTVRAWQSCVRCAGFAWGRAAGLLPAVPFWAGAIVASRLVYQKLPDSPPSCFVVTAALRGHPWLVGPVAYVEGQGSELANRQLRIFRRFEAIWAERAPRSHAHFRHVYNLVGPWLAVRVRGAWMADLVYLALKPAEGVAALFCRRAGIHTFESVDTTAPGENRTEAHGEGRATAGSPEHGGRGRFTRGTCLRVNAWVRAAAAAWFLLLPGIITVDNLCDPALSRPGIPRAAWRLHRRLTPRFARWARARIASGRAAHLPLHDVPSTEWPVFGSVFYLWGTEALQQAWEQQNPARRGPAPAETARPAIEAALAVVLDPVHHTWVRQHWGDDYLHTENVFFRSLLIAAVTSHARLTGSVEHLPLLRDQVTSLSAALDASPTGWLHDYPHECYPIDVLCAVACLQRAAALTGQDISAFVARERRGFTGRLLDPHGLPPYVADPVGGGRYDDSRGTGNSHILIFAPELWPDLARTWTDAYVRFFWQDRGWAAGFREYARDSGRPETFFEIDAGPVIAGFGPAANAFGLAAMRLNGRFDLARTLGAQVLASAWPLPDGTLLGARILSAAGGSHAPHLGEAALLFQMTQNPAPGVPVVTGGRLTPLVGIGLLFYFGLGGLWLALALRDARRARLVEGAVHPVVGWTWLLLLLAGVLLVALGRPVAGLAALFLATRFPRRRRARVSRP